MKFGERLREARKYRGMTISKLAEMCATSPTVIRNYEKSRRQPNIDMFVRICNAIKIDPNYLLSEDITFNPYEEKDLIYKLVMELDPKNHEVAAKILVSLKEER